MGWIDEGGADLLGVVARGRTRPGRCIVSCSNDEAEPTPVGRFGWSRIIDPLAATDEDLADGNDWPDVMALPAGCRGWMRVAPFTDPLADPPAMEGALADRTSAGWPRAPRGGATPYTLELSSACRKPWLLLPAGAPPWRPPGGPPGRIADGRSAACGA